MSQSKNNILYIAGAAVALVGGALLLHYFSGKQTEEGQVLSKALEEISALGEPKREANGLLSFPYYKEVFTIIMKNARSSFSEEKQELMKRRRELLRSGKKDQYKELVLEMIQKEEKVGTDLLADAMEHIGLSEQEFMQTHQFYMMNP